MWIEFWWASFLVILCLGWAYGRAWARAVVQGGPWVVVYCLMFAVSIFLVMQSLEAMLFRFLLLVVPGLLAWWYAGLGAPVGVSGRGGLALTGARR
jgi:hypothetical protein